MGKTYIARILDKGYTTAIEFDFMEDEKHVGTKVIFLKIKEAKEIKEGSRKSDWVEPLGVTLKETSQKAGLYRGTWEGEI